MAKNLFWMKYFHPEPENPSLTSSTSEVACQAGKTGSPRLSEAREEVWNRGLVAGLMLKMLLERPPVCGESEFQRHKLKRWMTSTLAARLAGHLPLASFNRLARDLEQWFDALYPLLTDSGNDGPQVVTAPSALSPRRCLLREKLLRHCLAETPGLLPRRRHRKLDQEKLLAFLESTGGGWFRLRDFEAFFRVDRKTAWEYVHKLLQAGFLVHNQGQSTAVRYCLAPAFIKPSDNPREKDAPSLVEPTAN